jgi:hypothetical protein
MHQARCLKMEQKEIKIIQTNQQPKIQKPPAETIKKRNKNIWSKSHILANRGIAISPSN